MALRTSYTTLAKFKTRLNVTDSDDDVQLETMLDAGAEGVDNYTRNPPEGSEAFTPTSAGVVRYYDDRVCDRLVFVDDVLAVTAVTRGGQSVSTDYWQLWPYNVGTGPFTAIEFRPDAPLPANNTWYEGGVGRRQLAITGTWGYCLAANRPLTIEDMTLRLAVIAYETQNLSSEALLQALNNPVTNEMKIVQAKLAPYRKMLRLA